MGEVAAESFIDQLPLHQTATKDPNDDQQLQVITVESRSMSTGFNGLSNDRVVGELNPVDAWLPITESRNGNIFYAVFHLISSGIGSQALLLPVAFAALGWTWGVICLSISFAWQLYTIWLLVILAESVPGTRYSRYLHLAVVAFGPKLGKLLAIFPVMYLSGGTCVMLIITAGGNMETLYKIACGGGSTCEAKSLTGVEWFLVFTCMAIAIAQILPNLNSVAKVSMVGAITAVAYCTFIWALSINKGRSNGVSYSPSQESKSDMAEFGNIFNAIGKIALAFRGHNLVLEIQGTLPSSRRNPSCQTMWKGTTISYLLIAMCLFPLTITGFWAYGNKVPVNGGLLSALSQVHGHNTSKHVMGTIYLLVLINSLSSFQIYAMPVFDNLEFQYVSKKKQRCPGWVRAGIRLFFGGLTFFIAVAFPFLGSLAPLIGGIALPLTYVYPCFMYILIKKPSRSGAMWWLNVGLGCLGTILSVMLVVAAAWNLADKGLHANFFRPK